MTILIHAIGPDVIAYPATLDDLRQEFPNCSFPIEPTAEDLAPFNRFFVTPIPAPSCEPRTERTEHTPTLTENGWQQAWSIRPATDEDIAAYDLAHQPEPDWDGFAVALILNAPIQAWFNALPQAIANGLSVGLNEVSKSNPGMFLRLWRELAPSIPAAMSSALATLAENHHLPPDFIRALSAPAAE